MQRYMLIEQKPFTYEDKTKGAKHVYLVGQSFL